MKRNKKRIAYWAVTTVVLIVACEVFLRVHYGFCNDVLYREDKDYEYIALPNQNRLRAGKRIKYNSLSMRSPEVDTDSSTVKILGFGDSIINGGAIISQDSLATSILQASLPTVFKKKWQLLNISSESWGPDNSYAYLLRHGDFNAKAIILFVNSADAHDTMTFRKTVGVDPDHLDKQYRFALIEFFDRYLPVVKNYFRNDKRAENVMNDKRVALNFKEDKNFNKGFLSFLNYSKEYNIPLFFYLHPDKIEFIQQDYTNEGHEIIHFAKEHNIHLIEGLKSKMDTSAYVDLIHVNEKGQRSIAEAIMQDIQQNSGFYKPLF